MNIDNLVEAITKEVMKRINEAIGERTNAERILVLENSNTSSELGKTLVNNGFAVDFLDSLKMDVEHYEAIVIPSMNNKELSNIALAVQNTEKDKYIIDALLRGKKVFLLEEGIEYRRFSSTANKVFFKVFREYEEKLKQFGIETLAETSLISSLKNKELKKVENNIKPSSKTIESKEERTEVKEEKIASSEVINFSKKKLISEVDIKNAYKNGAKEIIISKKSILTPLAKDFARINHLAVNKES